MKPVILVVDDDGQELARIKHELTSRYTLAYDIVCSDSSERAMGKLREYTNQGRDVALVLADQSMAPTPGVDFLAASKSLVPTSKRGLLIPWGAWGDEETSSAIVGAIGLGHIDYYVLKPWRSPDEFFHRTVTTFLHEWARERPVDKPQIAVVGENGARRSYEIRDLLTRFRIEHGFYPHDSEEGTKTLRRAGLDGRRLPAVVLLDGRALIDPSNHELADSFGVRTRLDTDAMFDVVVIGAGPAGLAAAVYGSSEGLRTLVIERDALGGQAGSSSLIRNYLGFAKGVSGAELAQQAYQQAWVFGTTFLMTREASAIRRVSNRFVVELEHGEETYAKTVVLANGVSYRRLDVPGLDDLIGAGVFYGSSAGEAPAMEGRKVFIVGGGNSAGQAAKCFSSYASKVTILVRGDSLAESMSDYLLKDIEAADNIDVRFATQVIDAGGEGRLQHLVLEDLHTSHRERLEADALFILIGARPYTEWLPDEIERDRWGFVLTGRDLDQDLAWSSRDRLDLETSVPGVFAAGDVRHGSLKRVASAVGEGSTAIRHIHEFLEHEGANR